MHLPVPRTLYTMHIAHELAFNRSIKIGSFVTGNEIVLWLDTVISMNWFHFFHFGFLSFLFSPSNVITASCVYFWDELSNYNIYVLGRWANRRQRHYICRCYCCWLDIMNTTRLNVFHTKNEWSQIRKKWIKQNNFECIERKKKSKRRQRQRQQQPATTMPTTTNTTTIIIILATASIWTTKPFV